VAERGGRRYGLALRLALTLLTAGTAIPDPVPAGAAPAAVVLDKFVYLPVVMNHWPPPPADIVFHSDIVGNYEIYKMKADGTNVVQLTNDSSTTYFDQSPSWVPGQGRIVFQSTTDVVGPNPGNDNEIYVMNADGTNKQRLTDNTCDDITPTWSPVNGRVAWSSNCNGEAGQTDYEIWTMDGTGADKQQITHNSLPDAKPRWSPVGPARIAYVSLSTIVIANADGTGAVIVVNGRDPDWSPNGQQLVYSCTISGQNREICIENAVVGGGGHVQVTALGATSFGPVWAPDGATLAFASNLIDVSDIFTVTASLSLATAGDVHRIPPSFTDAADESGVDW
jgi:Tol biopolymer transport system component